MKNYLKEISRLQEKYKTELFESCIPFWLNNSIDEKNGGIYCCLDKYGKIYSTDKSVWLLGRCAYMFSHLINVYGKNDEWLKTAKSCLDFLNNHCIDKTDGRMYFSVTEDGKPLRKRRYFFSETFYIIANAEYFKATGDKAALEQAKKYYDLVYNIYLDPVNDPYKITPKFIDGTRDLKSLAAPMILLNVNGIMRSCDIENLDKYNKISGKLIDDIYGFRFKDSYLMLETIGLNGQNYSDISACRVVNPGHSIELSWFLMDEAEYLGDTKLFDFAKKVFDAAFDFGWDKKYGGILYFKDIENKPVEAYEHDMKLWWPHAEALIATIKLYSKTKEEKYFKLFKKLTKYSFAHFSDSKNGEWYGYLRRDGKPTEPACKGHTYKGPFHVPRMLSLVEQSLEKLS